MAVVPALPTVSHNFVFEKKKEIKFKIKRHFEKAESGSSIWGPYLPINPYFFTSFAM